jgi:predicted nucleic acid-binding protein
VWITHFIEGETHATEFFRRVASCEYTIVCSEIVVNELIRNDAYSPLFFDEFTQKRKIVFLPISAAIRTHAKTLPTHYADALHAAIALHANIPLLTWNTKDFVINGLTVVKPNGIK